MKFRKDVIDESGTTREDVREIAEALSLYRSAMHHIAEREATRPFVAAPRSRRTIRFSLFLAPALTAALAAAVIGPVYSHFHHHPSTPTPLARSAQPASVTTLPNVDDTALMNQIDSEVSEDVPDALQPLADLSDQTTATPSVSEKKNVTNE